MSVVRLMTENEAKKKIAEKRTSSWEYISSLSHTVRVQWIEQFKHIIHISKVSNKCNAYGKWNKRKK